VCGEERKIHEEIQRKRRDSRGSRGGRGKRRVQKGVGDSIHREREYRKDKEIGRGI
jgi:hypothetical protein